MPLRFLQKEAKKKSPAPTRNNEIRKSQNNNNYKTPNTAITVYSGANTPSTADIRAPGSVSLMQEAVSKEPALNQDPRGGGVTPNVNKSPGPGSTTLLSAQTSNRLHKVDNSSVKILSINLNGSLNSIGNASSVSSEGGKKKISRPYT